MNGRDDDEAENGAPRIWIAGDIAADTATPLNPDQLHYLRNVLRLKPGAELSVFNGRDGEWLARLEVVSKSSGHVLPVRRTREQPATASFDCWLIFAPIKRTRIDLLVEKATELGASALLPVWTERTNVTRLNLERLRAHAREAAEQSERLDLPVMHEPQRLEQLLEAWPQNRRLLVCDETGTAFSLTQAVANLELCEPCWAILIGPEGGWAPQELDRFAKLSNVTRVGLGLRVLRADTAAIAALAVLQALRGDWDQPR